MYLMTELKQLQQEIQSLENQKKNLQVEIDQLEQKLKIVQDINVKGKVTLQCGTETSVEPQFHLKLDPKQRIEYAAIIAVFDGSNLTFGDTMYRGIQGQNLYGSGRWGPLRLVPLWERGSRLSVD